MIASRLKTDIFLSFFLTDRCIITRSTKARPCNTSNDLGTIVDHTAGAAAVRYDMRSLSTPWHVVCSVEECAAG